MSLAAKATAALLLTGCGRAPGDSDSSTAEESALTVFDGAGQVTDVSTGDDDDDQYAYEVDVDLENGEDVEVELDEDFAVLNQAELDAEMSAAALSAAPSEETSAPASESPAPTRAAASGAPPGADDDTPLAGTSGGRPSRLRAPRSARGA